MKYLILVLALTGCGIDKESQYRYVCNEFTSPWAYSAFMSEGGSIAWRLHRNNYNRTYYKVPEGHICTRQTRYINYE